MTLLAFLPGGADFVSRGLPATLEVSQCDLGASAALAVLRDLGSAEAFVDSFAEATTAVWPPRSPSAAPASTGFYFEAHVGSHGGRRFLEGGSTLYYKRVHDHDVGLAREIEALTGAAGVPARHGAVEAVVSRPGAGVSMHFDADAAFNIQIFGEKEWTWEPNAHVEAPVHAVNVAAGPSPDAVRHAIDAAYPTQMSERARTFTASPGTVIYLPRGVWHQTRVIGDQTSLAVVFSLEVRTLAAVFAKRLEAFLHDSPAWRQSAGARAEREHAWSSIAAAWEATLTEYGRIDSDDVRFALPPFACGRWQFAAPAGVRLALDGDALRVERADGSDMFELDDTLAGVRAALVWITARDRPFRAAELCDAMHARVEPIAVVELLRLLVKAELLVRAPGS